MSAKPIRTYRHLAIGLCASSALALAACSGAYEEEEEFAAAEESLAPADEPWQSGEAAMAPPPPSAIVAAPPSARAIPSGAQERAATPDAAPDIGPDVAPGVAFVYRFSFALADDKVSEAQGRHAAACERLGQNRCRVTAVRFDQQQDGPVTGKLSLLLDPALARRFAQDAVDGVRDLDGDLLEGSIGGEDVGTSIAASQQSSAALGGDLARIEARLAQPGLSAGERRDLSAHAEQMRGTLRNQEQDRRGGEARLASTPVEFSYRGSTSAAGFDRSRPFASAWTASSDSFGTAAAFVLMLIGLLLPWALMAGGVVLAVRWARRRLGAVSATPLATDGGGV